MTTAPPLLEYGPRPHGLRRRRTRLVILLALLGLACFAGYHWRMPVKQKALMLYWQRECMNYSPPADLVVYESDPEERQKLLAKDARYQLFTPFGARRSYVWFRPRAWLEFPLGDFPGPAFLHRRRSPNGSQRMAVVSLDNILGLSIYGQASDPGTLWSDPKPVFKSARDPLGSSHWLVNIAQEEVLRIYAGQFDENDPAHFTIDYAINGRRGTIDGKLDDSGAVLLTPRGGRLDHEHQIWIPAESELFHPTTPNPPSPAH